MLIFTDWQVGKMVHSMKMGWMKTPSQRNKELEDAQKDDQVYYDIWTNEDEVCFNKFFSFYCMFLYCDFSAH